MPFLSKKGPKTTIINYSVMILLLTISTITTQMEFTPIFHPELKVTQTAGEIKIDGFLNDPGWSGAAIRPHKNGDWNISVPQRVHHLIL